jgi:hypothetical protein
MHSYGRENNVNLQGFAIMYWHIQTEIPTSQRLKDGGTYFAKTKHGDVSNL